MTKNAKERKETPIFSGVLDYFPDAIRAVARCSYAGNEQHNPGTALHWDRSKSGDELDALTRHLMDAGTIDSDGIRHSAKVAWRALANLQKEIEREENDLKLQYWQEKVIEMDKEGYESIPRFPFEREAKEEEKRLMRLSDYPESNGVEVAVSTEQPCGWDNWDKTQ